MNYVVIFMASNITVGWSNDSKAIDMTVNNVYVFTYLNPHITEGSLNNLGKIYISGYLHLAKLVPIYHHSWSYISEHSCILDL